jgi:hypothetical protein
MRTSNAVKLLQSALKCVQTASVSHFIFDLLRCLALVPEMLDDENCDEAFKGGLCIEDSQCMFISLESPDGGEYQLVKELKIMAVPDKSIKEVNGIFRQDISCQEIVETVQAQVVHSVYADC